MINSAERELVLRKSCYPKWTKSGKMTEKTSAHEIACMCEIVKTLKNMSEEEEYRNEIEDAITVRLKDLELALDRIQDEWADNKTLNPDIAAALNLALTAIREALQEVLGNE